jgi:hypothetical protein
MSCPSLVMAHLDSVKTIGSVILMEVKQTPQLARNPRTELRELAVGRNHAFLVKQGCIFGPELSNGGVGRAGKLSTRHSQKGGWKGCKLRTKGGGRVTYFDQSLAKGGQRVAHFPPAKTRTELEAHGKLKHTESGNEDRMHKFNLVYHLVHRHWRAQYPPYAEKSL